MKLITTNLRNLVALEQFHQKQASQKQGGLKVILCTANHLKDPLMHSTELDIRRTNASHYPQKMFLKHFKDSTYGAKHLKIVLSAQNTKFECLLPVF